MVAGRLALHCLWILSPRSTHTISYSLGKRSPAE